ncbi:MAG TPA: hypothetical protein VMQ44_00775 [Candidatus Saccharimonadales bacterium]|nr:hypothetical protein [Candidatus Saccharimonadales bacterium]
MKKAFYLPLLLTFMAIIMIVTGSILSLAYRNYEIVRHQTVSNSALNIAEAGANYYLWHLAHNNQDYCDGNTCPTPAPTQYGPYTHIYRDDSGNIIGSYSITITPPATTGGSVTVRSVGTATNGQTRTVLTSLGVPSFAQYAFISNSESWFGDTETTVGPVHSNAGIHYDGTAQGVVSSAVSTYVPSTCMGGDGHTTENGIWGSGGPQSYWNFPVPQVDFNQITADFNTLQTQAQSNGIFLPTLLDSHGHRTYDGYAIQLNANGTFTLGRVTAGQDNGSINNGCGAHSRHNSLMQSVAWEGTSRALPANGILFVADNAWVWGTVTSRLTIASGRLPDNSSTRTNIYLQNDINYTAMDGSVALGLMSQSDIVVNSNSEDNLTIDAFLLSQYGKIFRPYYSGNVKSNITIYGGIAANSWWTWSWVNGSNVVISGYRNTSQQYDTHLALSPPPSFPKTGSYAILSWKEEPIL